MFTNPGAANEKGGVENLVQWAQRNFFSPVPRAASLAELNQRLLAECLADSQTRRRPRSDRLVADLWEEEQSHLLPLPASAFPACRNRFVRVDKTLLVTYDHAVYSAPAVYAYRELVAVLRLAEIVGVPRLAAAFETASQYRTFDLESVRSILAMATPEERPSPAGLGERYLDRWPLTPVPAVASVAYAWLDEAAAGRDSR